MLSFSDSFPRWIVVYLVGEIFKSQQRSNAARVTQQKTQKVTKVLKKGGSLQKKG